MLVQIPARALEAEHEEREAALERYTDCMGRAVLAEIIVVWVGGGGCGGDEGGWGDD